jgi:hypothetical protein
MFRLLILVAAFVLPSLAFAQVGADLKATLNTPWMLFGVMLLGTLLSGLQQIVDSRRQGGDVTVGSYFGKIPELLTAVILNVLAFATLIATDQLNFASALGIGVTANMAADLVRGQGRSSTL